MSNTLAISAVTEAFSALLRNVGDDKTLDPTLVTQDPPDRARTPQRNGHQLNLFLYQISPSPGLANADLPFRSSSGQILAQPQLALDLHYLLTAYGAGDSETDAQHVLAHAMSVLHDAGFIPRETIRSVVTAQNSPVAASDLADQIEPVRLTPQALGDEDLFRLWSMFQAKYRLSVGYTASVVLVERRRQFRKAPPVTRAGATAVTLRKPRIDEISPQPAQPGDTLTLIGGNLRADTVTVRINGVDRPTTAVGDDRITLALPGDVIAGPNVAQVVQGHLLNEIDAARDVIASEPVPFVVAPAITSALPVSVARGATLTLDDCTAGSTGAARRRADRLGSGRARAGPRGRSRSHWKRELPDPDVDADGTAPAPRRGRRGREPPRPGSDPGAELRQVHRAAGDGDMSGESLSAAVDALGARLDQHGSVKLLSALFRLTAFERSLLLLCAGVEMDADVARLCEQESAVPHATFGLALARLPAAHWSALSPGRPLRHWRLVEPEPAPVVTRAALRIDERVLHYLAGIQHLDVRVERLIRAQPPPGALAPTQQRAAEDLAARLLETRNAGRWPLAILIGPERRAKADVAAAAAERAGWALHVVRLAALPEDPVEAASLRRLWEREAALVGSALLVDCDEWELAEPQRRAALATFADGIQAALLVAAPDPPAVLESAIRVEVPRPPGGERRALWTEALGERGADLNGRLDAIVDQFVLEQADVRTAAADALAGDDAVEAFGDRLWSACRVRSRPRLDDLAERIETTTTWDDLVLPPPQLDALRQFVGARPPAVDGLRRLGLRASDAPRARDQRAVRRRRAAPARRWRQRCSRTSCALDLYRIDLSSRRQQVHRRDGEEPAPRVRRRRPRRRRPALRRGGRALRQAHARSSDSHDRYANIEVSYLLQRMEATAGLAILTTNLRAALDARVPAAASLRRRVPVPRRGAARRDLAPCLSAARRRPTGSTPAQLARLDIAGGSIRNIAVGAAFLAADAAAPVRMEHVVAGSASPSTRSSSGRCRASR